MRTILVVASLFASIMLAASPIKSNIGAKETGAICAEKMPYDAEVECLTTVEGFTTYINTGRPPELGDIYHIDFLFSAVNANWLNIFGSYTKNTGVTSGTATDCILLQEHGLNGNTNTLMRSWFGTNERRLHRINLNQRSTFVMANNWAELNGIRYTFTQTFAPLNTRYPIYIFTVNNAGNSVGVIKQTLSIYKYQVENNGKLVLDFIPVRFKNEVGKQEGAMFDKVSKKLFRNSGTGSFIIGPEKE